jgi:hypothetical protein
MLEMEPARPARQTPTPQRESSARRVLPTRALQRGAATPAAASAARDTKALARACHASPDSSSPCPAPMLASDAPPRRGLLRVHHRAQSRSRHGPATTPLSSSAVRPRPSPPQSVSVPARMTCWPFDAAECPVRDVAVVGCASSQNVVQGDITVRSAPLASSLPAQTPALETRTRGRGTNISNRPHPNPTTAHGV